MSSPERIDSGPRTEEHRAGFCAILGLPNVGKSTLLNRLVGEPLSIVTPKAQTTRRRIRAIHTGEDHQIVFVDTPGLMEPRYLLQRAMREEAEEARRDADVLLHVVDAGFERGIRQDLETPAPAGVPAVLCLNKVDRIDRDRREELEGAFREAGWGTVVSTVATEGRGVERLHRTITDRLPASPPLYPADQLATAPTRFFVAEFVREACFEELEEEVPYAVAVEIEQFREERDPLYIEAVIHVERESQKGIVIGKGGRTIRRIGIAARRRAEAFLDCRLYLDLWVKVLPKWRTRRSELERLGYHLHAGGTP